MILWVDAQISPDLAPWITTQFGVETHAIRDLGLKSAKDQEIYSAAGKAQAVVMTKDSDFVVLLERFGPPPQIIWLTCGNTSNGRLKAILQTGYKQVLQWLEAGERLIEISDASNPRVSR